MHMLLSTNVCQRGTIETKQLAERRVLIEIGYNSILVR